MEREQGDSSNHGEQLYGSFVMITPRPEESDQSWQRNSLLGSTHMWGPSRYPKNETPIFL